MRPVGCFCIFLDLHWGTWRSGCWRLPICPGLHWSMWQFSKLLSVCSPDYAKVCGGPDAGICLLRHTWTRNLPATGLLRWGLLLAYGNTSFLDCVPLLSEWYRLFLPIFQVSWTQRLFHSDFAGSGVPGFVLQCYFMVAWRWIWESYMIYWLFHHLGSWTSFCFNLFGV